MKMNMKMTKKKKMTTLMMIMMMMVYDDDDDDGDDDDDDDDDVLSRITIIGVYVGIAKQLLINKLRKQYTPVNMHGLKMTCTSPDCSSTTCVLTAVANRWSVTFPMICCCPNPR